MDCNTCHTRQLATADGLLIRVVPRTRVQRQGFNSTLVATYVGKRFLDEENVALVGGYAKLDATLGYWFGHFQLSLEGTNRTNQRAPVSASEFGSE